MDYISREAAIEMLTTPEPVNNGGIRFNRYPPSHDEVLRRLNVIHAANVREVKQGHWIAADEQPYFRKHYHTMVCSECGKRREGKWNFCPKCGADMRDEQK